MFRSEHNYKSSYTVCREGENLFVPLPNQRFVHHSPCPQQWVFPAACSALLQTVLSLKVLLRNWNSQTPWTPTSATPHGMMRISEMHFPRLNYIRLKQEITFNSASWHLSAAQLSLQYQLSLFQRLGSILHMGTPLSSKDKEAPQAVPAQNQVCMAWLELQGLECNNQSWHWLKGIAAKAPIPSELWQKSCSPLSKAQSMVIIAFPAALPKCQNRAVEHSKLQREAVTSWGAAPAGGEVPPSVLAPSRTTIQGGMSE